MRLKRAYFALESRLSMVNELKVNIFVAAKRGEVYLNLSTILHSQSILLLLRCAYSSAIFPVYYSL